MLENNCIFDNVIGKVYRHKRLFNYVVIPIEHDSGMVKCRVGLDSYKNIPMDYFKRDWKEDTTLTLDILLDNLQSYHKNTPFTQIYIDKYEFDDGLKHGYIHFNDEDVDKFTSFPKWVLTVCSNTERNQIINPYTMILAVRDESLDDVQTDLDIMNQMRKENDFIKIEDFSGFELGLIKYLEKKYIRDI